MQTTKRKLSHLEDHFSAHVPGFDDPMRAGGVLEWKRFDRRYVDQSTINQIRDLAHRVLSAVKFYKKDDLVEASSLGFLAITLNVAIVNDREDVDQTAAGPQHVQGLGQAGGPDGV